jgi:hypothetical protein
VAWQHFEQLKLRAEKKGKCGCGVRRRRAKTLIMTINPFNKNKQGIPKTREEVWADLQAAAKKWRAEPIICADCE